jgi:hypothetical protein
VQKQHRKEFASAHALASCIPCTETYSWPH